MYGLWGTTQCDLFSYRRTFTGYSHRVKGLCNWKIQNYQGTQKKLPNYFRKIIVWDKFIIQVHKIITYGSLWLKNTRKNKTKKKQHAILFTRFIFTKLLCSRSNGWSWAVLTWNGFKILSNTGHLLLFLVKMWNVTILSWAPILRFSLLKSKHLGFKTDVYLKIFMITFQEFHNCQTVQAYVNFRKKLTERF